MTHTTARREAPTDLIHVPRDLLLPDHMKYMGAIHMGYRVNKPREVKTGCKETVSEKLVSFNPRKVNCPKCIKFAIERTNQLSVLFKEMSTFPKARDLRSEIQDMAAFHEAHMYAFQQAESAKPWANKPSS